jgi:asparagine synthase (glutamine-hydrolysing)
MCGISGIIHFGNSKYPIAESLHRMSAQMRNRGPDDEGFLLGHRDQKTPNVFYGNDSPTEVKNHLTSNFSGEHIAEAYRISAHAGFAHRRLSIVDLSYQGHQPMTTQDRRHWIIYNGEIYNFREITKMLSELGQTFQSTSDTEVLLKGYMQWGPEVLNRLNGMFSFAIWDDHEKSLFCARDRIGIKPFYYTIQNKIFIFASDIKTLIASRLFRPEPNMEGLYHNMSFGITPRPMTSFKGVYALNQGHWMKVEQGGNITSECYWKLPVGTQDLSMERGEAEELLENALTKSVERRLQADVPVGTFMSGGIDSTLISAIASRKQSGIKAFTLAYENYADEMSETEQAKATAAMHPMTHIIKTVKLQEPQEFLAFFEDNLKCYEEPYYSFCADYVISEFAGKNGVKVVLNGLGADELFAGYSYYRWIRLLPLLQVLSPILPFSTPLLGYLGKRINVISKARSPSHLHTSAMSRMTEKEKQALFNNDSIRGLDSIEYLNSIYVGDNLKFADGIEAFNYMDMKNYLGNHHVYRTDQCTMRFSLEGRFPFLDHELVELAFRIPSKYKLHNGVGKLILKDVAKNHIHPSCIEMKKKGFGLPAENWIKGPVKEFSVESMNKLASRNFINRKYINSMIKGFHKGYIPYTQIWSLVSMEKWFELFIDNKVPLHQESPG